MQVPDGSDFSSEFVGTYDDTRVNYPESLPSLLAPHIGLNPVDTVVDFGSGTGLLSKVFLDYGCTVIGVEPSRRMRELASAKLSSYPTFSSVAGRAEASTLSTAVARLAVAGQAVHQFLNKDAWLEVKRVLQPGGSLVMIWTYLAEQGSPLVSEIHRLIVDIGKPKEGGFNFQASTRDMARRFAGSLSGEMKLTDAKSADRDSLSRYFSTYPLVPPENDPDHAVALAGLQRIFQKYQVSGRVHLDYDVFVYWCKPHERMQE